MKNKRAIFRFKKVRKKVKATNAEMAVLELSLIHI